MISASYPVSLDIELRRRVYIFTLSIYEAFESLMDRGVLAADVEKSSNQFLKLVAAYPAKENKGQILKDIIAEAKGTKALLGIVRDIRLVESDIVGILMNQIVELESEFYAIEPKQMEVEPVATTDLDAKRNLVEAVMQLPEKEPILEMPALEEGAMEDPESVREEIAENMSQLPDQIALLDREILRAEKGDEPLTVVTEPILDKHEHQSIAKRQEAIVEVLKRRDAVSVGELARLFTGIVGQKTLQRDLQDLVEKHIVSKSGEKRWTVYSLAKV
ncbi:MAG: hypothetical protein A3H71_00110 [Candidatus Sungbacteria bacterium RIFCSPLOWO2_02_FULL_48_13b]|uniref:HTH deoR-type domain-containing protein n=2 Tax=Candidatus Sungiibacteriota TaxID=1817917 RepID=A0A1G2LJW6_9BACT|nr:MAG: hypothetical protein A3C12_01395 [Candidatus Sungbacteria bacterium RIFCSPHIGHO2_02_FULL_49_20]OHA11102.1 MAG: hypothetical protein A3H71_00110 [Candidatus Sungbacteria bacterium RIFCSPLOWO2_02_FULL_48_13b]